MFSAEFKTRREALQIPSAWFAERLEVTRRAAHQWEAGRRFRVPESAVSLLAQAELTLTKLSLEITDQATALAEAHDLDRLVFVRYRSDTDFWTLYPRFEDPLPYPATWHGAALLKAMPLVGKRNPDLALGIAWYDDEQYLAWAQAHKLERSVPANWLWATQARHTLL